MKAKFQNLISEVVIINFLNPKYYYWSTKWIFAIYTACCLRESAKTNIKWNTTNIEPMFYGIKYDRYVNYSVAEKMLQPRRHVHKRSKLTYNLKKDKTMPYWFIVIDDIILPLKWTNEIGRRKIPHDNFVKFFVNTISCLLRIQRFTMLGI